MKKDKKYTFLNLMNIPIKTDLEKLRTAEELDDIEFTMTAPTGLSVNEVENYVESTILEVVQYRELLEKRDRDIITLADEIERIQALLLKNQEENQLADLIKNSHSKESKLSEEITDLRIENAKLKNEIKLLKQTTNKPKTYIRDEVPKLPKIDDGSKLPDL